MALYLSQLSLLAIALTSGWLPDVTLWRPANHESGCDVQRIKDVPYCHADDVDRHRLDMFLPKDRKNYPVVVLVHGGAWCVGDNRCYGLYSSVGEYLASRGIGVVLPNYRLSPHVKHPEHIQDIASAVAWTYRHIRECDGNPEQLFLVGHSAGGHLVALLATDEKYLKAEGLSTDTIRGVVGVSGVYRIAPGKVEATVGGSFRLDQVFPVRSTTSKAGGGFGIPLSVNVFGAAFGDVPQERADASPINHVRAGLPRFLLVNAENDLPTLDRIAEDFYQALKTEGCEACRKVFAGRNHSSVFFCAMQPSDPVAQAIEEFVFGQGRNAPCPGSKDGGGSTTGPTKPVAH
jgi:acetyl esterase/lipase